MFKKIATLLGVLLLLFSAVEASEPLLLKVKGIKGSPVAFDVDGTVYMEPSFLEKGGIVKILWENEKTVYHSRRIYQQRKGGNPFQYS